MSVFHNNALIGAGAGTGDAAAAAEYVIPKSLRFNSGDSAHLDKTFASAGNRRTWTWSGWLKRSKFDQYSYFFTARSAAENYFILSFTDDNLKWYNRPSSGTHRYATTDAVFRDAAAWYHVVLAWDTTESTDSDRVKLYVNGERITSFSASVWPAQNEEGVVNDNHHHEIGAYNSGTQYQYNGLMADVQFVDGQALAPTDFGETRSSDGVWVPKEASFTSPNDGTTWSNSTVTTGTIDSSYPLTNAFNGSIAQPNTRSSGANTTITITLTKAISFSSKVRIYQNQNGTANINSESTVSTSSGGGSWITVFTGSGSLTSLTLTSTGGDTVSLMAIEVDGVILQDGLSNKYGVNGFHLNFSDSSTNEALGFDSAPTIPDLDPKKGMDVITYDGTYARLNVGGLNFEPGLVWIKNRDSGTSAHFLADSVRGGTKVLQSNSTGAENTRSNHILSFNPDGFTLGADGTSNYPSGNSFVAWTWRAGGPAVANSDGTITSQVSASTDYGFSIVTYTGGTSDATIGHGLGQTPKFYIVKARESSGYTDSWNVYHTSLGESAYIKLNDSGGRTTASTIWNETAPTSTVFSVDANSNANENNTDYVAYVWSEVSGYSKFGSYTGNGSDDGAFIETGFKPRWILIKSYTAPNANSHSHWLIYDTERSPSNEADDILLASATGAEISSAHTGIDILENGFKLKADTLGYANFNTNQYIYAAFADRPGNNWDVNNIVTNEGLTTSKTQFDVVTYTGNGGTNIIGGVVYSAGATATGGFEASNPAANGFNGTLTAGDRANGVTVGGTIEIVFSPGLSVSSTVGIWSGKSGFKYQINDSGSYTSVTNATEQWHDASFSGTLTNLKIQHTASNEAPGFSGIRVDGSTLIDGDGGPGLKFQPDFVWIKSRSSGTEGHYLANSVSGLTKNMRSNATSAEQTNTNGVTAADANGFTLGDSGRVNGSSQNYVAWCWKAGGTAVSNTDGSITSSVSANAQYGFSIVSYTGTGSNATVGHGLNTAPKLVIARTRDRASNWAVYHGSVANMATGYLYLNSTIAFATDASDIWNSIDPTSSVFSIGTAGAVNTSSDDHIAYCFADVPGYQRIGSYTGNGSSTGPVVVTGFKPRFLLIKAAVGYSSGSWIIVDSERSTTNPTDHALFPNSSNIENNLPSFGDRDIAIDFLSNGFQIKNSLDADNKSSVDYIYLAIGDDEIGSDEDCLVDVPNAVTADADATDTTGGYQRGNYATLNPLDKNASVTLANGNLDYDKTGTAGYGVVKSTIAVSSGKWYCEYTLTGNETSKGQTVGVTFASHTVGNSDYLQSVAGGFGYYSLNGNIYTSTGNSSYGNTFDVGDTIGIALDMDNGKLFFSKNGVFQNSGNPASGTNPAASGLSGDYVFGVHGGTTDTTGPAGSYNFGQMRFKYPMPSGYAALNTTALPAATIPDGSAQFDTKTYTSNATARSITGYEFGPDWLWFKPRNVQGSHNLYDTVRGATKGVRSHANDAEYTDAQTVTSFNSDGFSLGTDSNGYQVNYSNNSMVVWAWNGGANSDKTYTVKVVSDSGNKYRFDDHGTSAVTLDLAEGSTYIFDQSDSSNAGHPIRFGTSANGTDYTTGVTHTGTPGSAGAKTTLVLASGAPTLYYSCANHSGMGGQINTNSTAGSTRLSGSENSVVYNQSQNYTNNVSSTSNITSGHEARLFNGILSGSNADIQSSQGTSGVINFTTAITGSKIEIYTVGNIGQIGINGSNLSVTANQFVDTGVTSLTSVETRHPSAGYVQNPTALRVDGKILVDSNVTPPAVPSINSVVKANPEAGFSIVTFTGTGSNATVNHGLNAKPDFYVVKRRSAADDWECYHSALGATYYGKLNATDVWTTSGGTARWNDTEPTSSVFSVGTTDNVNGSGSTYVAYVMSAVSGYSAFGSYEANGSADGPFVFTSFRPALVICKSADQAQPWQIFDSAREPKNVITKGLQANSTGAEYDTTARLDFLSNGFKIRAGGGSEPNVSGNTYIYLAFAENPFSANGGLAR